MDTLTTNVHKHVIDKDSSVPDDIGYPIKHKNTSLIMTYSSEYLTSGWSKVDYVLEQTSIVATRLAETSFLILMTTSKVQA